MMKIFQNAMLQDLTCAAFFQTHAVEDNIDKFYENTWKENIYIFLADVNFC